MNKLIIILIASFLNSCTNTSYFSFNEVIHFHKEINDKNYSDENNSPLYFENYPSNFDSNFVLVLKELKYLEASVDTSKFKKLLDIYRSKTDIDFFGTKKCAPVYRDIIVFKKENKIMGISKICFECDMDYTIDNKGNLKESLVESDFLKLKSILE